MTGGPVDGNSSDMGAKGTVRPFLTQGQLACFVTSGPFQHDLYWEDSVCFLIS